MHSPLHPLDDHVSCVYFMLMMDNVMAALLLRTKCARVLLLVGILLTGGWLDAFGQGSAPGVRLSTRQFLNEGEPYLEVQVEFMAEGLQWLPLISAIIAFIGMCYFGHATSMFGW